MAKHLAPPTIHCSGAGAILLCRTARLQRVHRLGVAPSIVDRHYLDGFIPSDATQERCLVSRLFHFYLLVRLVNFVILFHK